MENNLKFNSAICTSVEQSERLVALGLKKETADMHWFNTETFGWQHCSSETYIEAISHPFKKEWATNGVIQPAWSLHRLIEMMPKTIGRYFQYTSNYSCGYMDEDALNMNGGFDEGNIYDSIISCIEWLIKEGYFNKEYLV